MRETGEIGDEEGGEGEERMGGAQSRFVEEFVVDSVRLRGSDGLVESVKG